MSDIKQPDEEAPQQAHQATQDEQLLETPRPDEFRHTDTWRVFRIMGEFVEGFDELATVTRGVAVFGSARTRGDDSYYAAAQETSALLARGGFTVITGGGPGIMEAANRGSFGRADLVRGGRGFDRLQHRASLRAAAEPLPDALDEVQILLRS